MGTSKNGTRREGNKQGRGGLTARELGEEGAVPDAAVVVVVVVSARALLRPAHEAGWQGNKALASEDAPGQERQALAPQANKAWCGARGAPRVAIAGLCCANLKACEGWW